MDVAPMPEVLRTSPPFSDQAPENEQTHSGESTCGGRGTPPGLTLDSRSIAKPLLRASRGRRVVRAVDRRIGVGSRHQSHAARLRPQSSSALLGAVAAQGDPSLAPRWWRAHRIRPVPARPRAQPPRPAARFLGGQLVFANTSRILTTAADLNVKDISTGSRCPGPASTLWRAGP